MHNRCEVTTNKINPCIGLQKLLNGQYEDTGEKGLSYLPNIEFDPYSIVIKSGVFTAGTVINFCPICGEKLIVVGDIPAESQEDN